MVALALNAWFTGRQNDQSEGVYLSLFSRDIGQTRCPELHRPKRCQQPTSKHARGTPLRETGFTML